MGPSLFQFCGLWIEVKSLWDQRSESPDPMALFCFPKVCRLLVDLFDHKDREILQGSQAFGIEMTSHWFFQMSMFKV